MNPLDELRKTIQKDIDATPHTSSACIENVWYVEGVRDALLRLDQFEAAHPELVDQAERGT